MRQKKEQRHGMHEVGRAMQVDVDAAPEPPRDAASVIQLFTDMSATYGLINMISSFGFSHRWRRQCVDAVVLDESARVLDMMTGMGEAVRSIRKRVGSGGAVTAVDFCPAMTKRAEARYGKGGQDCPVNVVTCDVLSDALPMGPFDAVVSTFGLKTFSAEQTGALAKRVFEVLKPGGGFSFVEISVPKSRVLRWPFMLYLRHVIPVIGWVCMGNANCYRYLGRYTTAFGSCTSAAQAFREAGLEVEVRSLFFGCATILVGRRPV